MSATRILAVLATLALLSTCGDDDEPGDTTTTTVPAVTTTTVPTTVPTTTTTAATTTTTAVSTTTAAPTTTVPALEQPAIWPAPDVVFATPQAAAADFVTNVLAVPPVLGDFRQGDSRSGEIEVLSPAEGSGPPVPRGLLFLRQLGPASGWFVLGAANDFAFISSPEASDTVPAGPLTVEGRARGFEANVAVSAFAAGDADAVFDSEITMGGSAETAEPFTVTLDLSGATPGQVVTLLVRGGAGLETDPGEFGAIPVVIAGRS